MENFTIKNSKKINLTINWRLRISRSSFSSLLNLFLVRRNYFNAVKSKSISKYVSEQSRGQQILLLLAIMYPLMRISITNRRVFFFFFFFFSIYFLYLQREYKMVQHSVNNQNSVCSFFNKTYQKKEVARYTVYVCICINTTYNVYTYNSRKYLSPIYIYINLLLHFFFLRQRFFSFFFFFTIIYVITEADN